MQDSHLMVEQIRVIDRVRLSEGPLTRLSSEEVTALERTLRGVLGMI